MTGSWNEHKTSAAHNLCSSLSVAPIRYLSLNNIDNAQGAEAAEFGHETAAPEQAAGC